MLSTIQSRIFCLLKSKTIRIYKTIILSVVLYGCENCSLTLREDLRLPENKVLRSIFGLKRHELTRSWRKLHSEELHNLYS
jgi:hypothetical protein